MSPDELRLRRAWRRAWCRRDAERQDRDRDGAGLVHVSVPLALVMADVEAGRPMRRTARRPNWPRRVRP